MTVDHEPFWRGGLRADLGGLPAAKLQIVRGQVMADAANPNYNLQVISLRAIALAAVCDYLFDLCPLDVAQRALDALGQDEVIALRAVVGNLGADAVALDLRDIPVERAPENIGSVISQLAEVAVRRSRRSCAEAITKGVEAAAPSLSIESNEEPQPSR